MPVSTSLQSPAEARVVAAACPSPELTQMLVAWNEGSAAALEQITPAIYSELRRLARSYMRRERADHTLQGTAVVHEAYLRLLGERVLWNGREHFLAVAAQTMRRILVDHARARGAAKRGDAPARVPLEEHMRVLERDDVDVLALDQVLHRLAAADPARAQLVELKFFGGLTKEEIAEVLGVAPVTVQRQWAAAKAWLFHELRARK